MLRAMMTTRTQIAGRRRGPSGRIRRAGALAMKRDDMHNEREVGLAMLRAQIARGDYQVDNYAVADAILRRVGGWKADPPGACQNECSYPSSSPSSTSAKTTPGVASVTRPIHVKPLLAAVSSASLRALGGMQAQSS